MPRYVALLRGINVGGHRVKMDRLREIFEQRGFVDVATFIASGNVIFSAASDDAASLEREIEHHLERELGYEVPTFIRTPAELAAVAQSRPVAAWGDMSEEDSHYVIFFRAAADEEVRQRLADLSSDTDDFQFSGREVYWLIRGKMSESPLFGTGITKATGRTPTTARNITSIRRLVAKHGVEE